MKNLIFPFVFAVSLTLSLGAQIDFDGSNYFQNFNNLPTTGSLTLSGTNTIGHHVAVPNIPGWFAAKIAGSGSDPMTINANHGTLTGGRLYSYGASSASDRALGTLASGTNTPAFGAAFVNTSGDTITAVRLNYRHEIWAAQGTTGSNVYEDRLEFAYGLSSASVTVNNFLTSSNMTAFAPLDAVSSTSNAVLEVQDGSNPSRARDGNSAEWASNISAVITGLNWAPGQTLFIRWQDSDTPGFDAGHGIDDLSLSIAEDPAEDQGPPPALGIRMDGDFSDWHRNAHLIFNAPIGDGWAGGIDIEAIGASVGVDGLSIYLRTVEPFVIGSSSLQIRIDTDGDPATGNPFLGLGWDVMLDFGVPQTDLRFFPAQANFASGATLPAGEFISELYPNGMNELDTHPESREYEMLIPLSVLPNVQPGGRIGLSFRDASNAQGDIVPSFGQTFHTNVPEHLFIEYNVPSLDKINPDDVRIAVWNVLHDGPTKPEFEEAFARQLIATRPDIINFQEMWVTSSAWVKDFLDRWVPWEDGSEWHVTKYGDCMTASRFPIKQSWPIQPRNLIVWLDTKAEMGMDMVIVNAHTKAHVEFQSQRISETDIILNQLRRLRLGEDPSAPEGDFMVFAVGDYNANSPKLELTGLRSGTFSRTSQQMLNFWPDDYERPLVDAAPRHTHRNRISTWESLTSGNTQRLDYIFYPETRATKMRSFTLETSTMPLEFRSQYGLAINDSRASDHLLMIGDFRPRVVDYAWQAVDHIEEGWFYSEWFGPVFVYEMPFAYHAYHGPIYTQSGEFGVWIWDTELGWWYTHGTVYPFAYSVEMESWVYFGPDDEQQRRFYNYAESIWVYAAQMPGVE